MSLTRYALRLCAVEALRDATVVGGNVRDSDFGAIDTAADGTLRTDQDRPFILVYTDESTVDEAGLRDLRENGDLDFVCEFGVTAAMTVRNEETGAAEVVSGIPATDANFEALLDVVARQITATLTGASTWADLWSNLAGPVRKIEVKRASDSDNGVRLAARQMRITVGAKPDPVWKQPLAETSIWARLREAAEKDAPESLSFIDLLLGAPDEALTYDMIRASRGHTKDEARSLGYGAADEANPDATIDVEEVEIDGQPS